MNNYFEYTVSPKVISSVIDDLKKDSYITKNHFFDYSRKERPDYHIYYNDYSFLDALGNYRSKETIEEIVDFLKQRKICMSEIKINEALFINYVSLIRNHFIVPWKSFTPTMDRLVYTLSRLCGAKRVLAVGVNCGHSLAYLLGSFYRASVPGFVTACEKRPLMLKLARQNLSHIKLNCDIQFCSQDAYFVLDTLENESYDLIFLDTRRNIKILYKLYEKLKPNGWLLMHNASDVHFADILKPYSSFMRDEEYFQASVLFRIDNKGLEMAVKNS